MKYLIAEPTLNSELNISINQIMTRDPVCINGGESLEFAERLMKDNKITVLFIKHENKLVGIIELNQCLV